MRIRVTSCAFIGAAALFTLFAGGRVEAQVVGTHIVAVPRVTLAPVVTNTPVAVSTYSSQSAFQGFGGNNNGANSGIGQTRFHLQPQITGSGIQQGSMQIITSFGTGGAGGYGSNTGVLGGYGAYGASGVGSGGVGNGNGNGSGTGTPPPGVLLNSTLNKLIGLPNTQQSSLYGNPGIGGIGGIGGFGGIAGVGGIGVGGIGLPAVGGIGGVGGFRAF